MKTYMAVTAVSMLSLIGLAVVSIPFEGERMARDRAAQARVAQPRAEAQTQEQAGESPWSLSGGALPN